MQESEGREDRVEILFLSEGNVCRSIYAEAIFNSLVRQLGVQDELLCSSRVRPTDCKHFRIQLQARLARRRTRHQTFLTLNFPLQLLLVQFLQHLRNRFPTPCHPRFWLLMLSVRFSRRHGTTMWAKHLTAGHSRWLKKSNLSFHRIIKQRCLYLPRTSLYTILQSLWIR